MSKELFLRATAPETELLPIPVSMLVFAHPDDEVVALGARLGRFASALFVHVTDGAPTNEQDSRAHGFATLDQYRQAREEELSRALAMAGLCDVSRVWLRIPDQGASFQLPHLAHQIEQLLLLHKPEVVFTHPYEGGHPDHDACAFGVHRAVASLLVRGQTAPVMIEAAFYHAGPAGIEAGCFLPRPEQAAEVEYRLSKEERLHKESMLACFSTQEQTLRNFPLEWERFRIAPQYDFRRPPHSGPVLYDQFPWGISSAHFGALAREALALQPAASPCL
jgi:LmbE family N-acetylglucosaminyl deacetylase